MQEVKVPSSDEMLMSRIMKIINDNLAEPSLSVEMLANSIGLSRVHLYRKLKELTNLSTRDFIRNIRMQQAAKLLKEKKLSISDVAYAVGYSNLSHFSNTFKDLFGQTPKEYMQAFRDLPAEEEGENVDNELSEPDETQSEQPQNEPDENENDKNNETSSQSQTATPEESA